MTPSRRLSNGRSPLVRKQSQITTFFSAGNNPVDPPTPRPTLIPNANPKCIPNPSQLQPKPKKSPLLIPPSPSSNPSTPPNDGKKTYSAEVVGRRIKIFWPLDNSWYEGRVKSFDKASGKHLIQYGDAEEEEFVLGDENIEWVEEEPSRGLRRLRRMSDSAAQAKTLAEDENSGDDTTDDEDWGKGVGKDAIADESEEMELEDEDELPISSRSRVTSGSVGMSGSVKSRKASSSVDTEKRKKISAETLKSIKKVKFDEDWGKGVGKAAIADESEEMELEDEDELPISSRSRVTSGYVGMSGSVKSRKASSSVDTGKRKKIAAETLKSIKKVKFDEDWGKGVGKAAIADESEEMELEDEDELPISSRSRVTSGYVGMSGSVKSRKASSSVDTGKRKKIAAETLKSIKKVEFDGSGEKSEVKTPQSKGRSDCGGAKNESGRGHSLDNADTSLVGDAAERFGKREAEKFSFLGMVRKDACGRRPGNADYDPRTLFLPNDFLRRLTGGQRQWWEFKSKHMDKVLFFKMGKFYELFEMDAHVGAGELDLQYMKGEQPHCGFPEKNFSLNLDKLVRKGYRVLVVEQTETPEQLELRRKEMGSKDKVVKREVCAMVTKGTLTEGESLLTNPDASYMMSITESCKVSQDKKEEETFIGLCVIDVSTSKFMVGQFQDDLDRRGLCSVLAELRPCEIIKPSNVLSPETERVLRVHTRNPLINDLVPFSEFWDAEKTIHEISNYYMLSRHSSMSGLPNDGISGVSVDRNNVDEGLAALPNVLAELASAGTNGRYALSALGGCLFYLRQAFLDQTLLKCAKFELLPCWGFHDSLQKQYMLLDAAALENIEILENRNGGSSGTLFAQLDHCMTAFGKRLLKYWLARPLYELEPLVERQDAIAGFKGAGLASALEFRKELARLPDMERLLARLFASCDAKGRNASSVILYEDAAKKQLQEFVAALRGCEVMFQACSSLNTVLCYTKSSLLRSLLTCGKVLPDVSSVLKHFKDAFDWSEASRSGRIIPHEGGDIEYGAALKTVKEIESSLTRHLKDQRKLLGDTSIDYVSVGKDLYLLEVPESLSGAVPRDYELRSSRKGFTRFWTPKIKEYLSELSLAEADKEFKLKSILQRLIKHFSEHHNKWRQLVSVIAELDVLISLAIISDYYEGPICRPVIKEQCYSSDIPCLSAKSLGHPVLRCEALGKCSFVPNDVTIGGEGNASFILLTGPNMGGKSTLLRQVCMAVILAQIGADVPAESFELSLVDRIFVRMGATDHIMAGQSTFLMELSETASMLSAATRNSLVVLDELGRGTSTSDGQAIAGSVLEYFVHEIQCRGLFSTHYHRLAVEYEKDNKVSLCHMSCKVGRGIEGIEEVTFLYKLTPGSCPKSYGVNVARLAGIHASVLQKAMAKSSEFESTYGNRRHEFEGKLTKQSQGDHLALLHELLRIVDTRNDHEDTIVCNMSSLRELQKRAELLFS